MKKLIILLSISITTFFEIKAQLIKKSDLQGFRWFTDNSSRSFYNSDTVFLNRITDSFPEYLELNRDYRELDYNKNNNVTTIEFKKNKNLDILDHDIKSWTVTRLFGKWKWKFDSDRQQIIFYFKGKFHSSFLVKEKLQDTLINKYVDSKNKPIEEIYHLQVLTLIRLR